MQCCRQDQSDTGDNRADAHASRDDRNADKIVTIIAETHANYLPHRRFSREGWTETMPAADSLVSAVSPLCLILVEA